MDWFNYIGLIMFVLIMVPNIVYAYKCKAPDNEGIPNPIIIIENVGRYGSLLFLIFNIPYTYFSFFFPEGLTVYIVVNSILVVAYIALYILLWKKQGLTKALLLSIIPSVIFLFSGIMVRSILLIVFSLLFTFGHIYISVRNAAKKEG